MELKKSKHKVFSLHPVMDEKNLPFEAEEYSQFKYGSKSIARKFGKELGRCMSYFLYNLPLDTQFIVVPSPYCFVPTATFAMKDYMIAAMNHYLSERGFQKPVQETKVFRNPSYVTDYGKMDIEDRKKAIGSEEFIIDKLFLQDKYVIFLDDIRITGAHEERMEEMIERYGLEDVTTDIIFTYFAELKVLSDPAIEDFLNLCAMKSLLDLDKIIKNDEFIFNTRSIKFILDADHEDCKNFMNYQSHKFLETLYSNALGNGYHLADKFAKNFNYLKSKL